MQKHNPSRRQFAKKLAYVAPAVLTLKASPSFAAAGSHRTGGSQNINNNSNHNSNNDDNRRGRGRGRD